MQCVYKATEKYIGNQCFLQMEKSFPNFLNYSITYSSLKILLQKIILYFIILRLFSCIFQFGLFYFIHYLDQLFSNTIFGNWNFSNFHIKIQCIPWCTSRFLHSHFDFHWTQRNEQQFKVHSITFRQSFLKIFEPFLSFFIPYWPKIYGLSFKPDILAYFYQLNSKFALLLWNFQLFLTAIPRENIDEIFDKTELSVEWRWKLISQIPRFKWKLVCSVRQMRFTFNQLFFLVTPLKYPFNFTHCNFFESRQFQCYFLEFLLFF